MNIYKEGTENQRETPKSSQCAMLGLLGSLTTISDEKVMKRCPQEIVTPMSVKHVQLWDLPMVAQGEGQEGLALSGW